jgi:uncharacterized protein YprB with RNaseH-like and TPR domain
MSNNKRILLFDIESTPNLGYTWEKWQQNVISFKKEWELLSFAYKWLGEKEVYCIARNDFKDKTDKSLTMALKDVLEQSDVVIAHNGDAFDIKKANAKFIEHNLGPLKPIHKIDTKKIAKKYFKFNSNSLDDLGALLKVGRKQKTGGFDLWLGCMAGKKASFDLMKKYNKQDVVLLEKVYLRLRPWMEVHPNVYIDRPSSCPKCGGTSLENKGIVRRANSNYRSFKCRTCSGYCRSRVTDNSIAKSDYV